MADFEKSIAMFEVLDTGYFNVKRYEYIYVSEPMHNGRAQKPGNFLTSYTRTPTVGGLINQLSG